MSLDLTSLPQLERDVRKAAATLGRSEARTLVYLYYGLQDFRIQANNQVFAMSKNEEPHATVGFFHGQFLQLEKDIAKALDTYSKNQPLGEWARQHIGVGPVIAAGLLAHIPIEKTPTPSALWRFAGLTPGQRYQKGVTRDWNASLKLLCWKLGDSFVKQSGRDNCYYGKLYRRRKEMEVVRNEAVHPAGNCDPDVLGIPDDSKDAWIYGSVFRGGNCQAAVRSLMEKNIKDKELKATLMSGKLPDGQIDMRARRYAVKRFLLHYWQAAYWLHYKTEPPRAYVFEHLGHVDEEPCPISMPTAA